MLAEFTLVQKYAIWALPLLFAITIPEMARGYAARALGDFSGQGSGRLSPNPLRYVDPIGTLLVPGILIAIGGGFLIGWPKTLPVDPRNFKKPLRDIALSSLAVPAASFGIAIVWALILRTAVGVDGSGEGAWMGVRLMAVAGVKISLVLMVLNLIPIPPLAGGHLLMALLPPRAAYQFAQLERYSFFILLALLLTGVLGQILFWPAAVAEFLLYTAVGMPAGSPLLPST